MFLLFYFKCLWVLNIRFCVKLMNIVFSKKICLFVLAWVEYMIFIKIFFCFLGFLLMHSALAVDPMADAEYFFANGNYSKAILHLKEVLKKDPQNAKARYFLGSAYLKSGELKFVEKELSLAYQIEPDNIKYRLHYARSLLFKEKYNETLSLISFVSNDPLLEGERLNLLAIIFYVKKQYKEAEKYFHQAVKKGCVKANIGLAKLALSNKELKKAGLFIDQFLNAEPDNRTAWKLKARIFNLSGEYQQAIGIYNRLINDDKSEYELYLQRTASLLALNRLPEAEADINFILGKNNNLPIANYLMAKLRFQEKKYKEAEKYSQRILEFNSQHIPSLFITASSSFALGDYNLAEKRFLELLTLEPDNTDVYIMLANVYLAQNSADSALLILDTLSEDIRNNNIQVLTILTHAQLAAGQYNTAMRYLRRAQEIDPDNKAIEQLIITSRIQAQEMGTTKSLFHFSESYKKSRQADYLLLALYFQEKQFDTFKQQLNQFINNMSYDPYLYVIKAKFELYNNNPEAAKALFNKALKYNRQHIAALAGLAELAYKDNDYPLSHLYYQQIIAIDNTMIDAYLALTKIAEQKDDLLSAENYLKQNYQNNKGNIVNEIKVLTALVQFFDKYKMPAKKALIANMALNNNPDNIHIQSIVFDIQMSLKNYSYAEKIIRKLIKKDNKNAGYYLLLAQLLAKQSNNEEELFRLWDKVFNLDQTTPIALTAKYDYLLQHKRYKAALFTAKQVQGHFPLISLGLLMEGKVYRLSDKIKLALETYQLAFLLQTDAGLAVKIADLMTMQSGKVNNAIVFLQKQVDNPLFDNFPVLLRLAELNTIKKDYQKAITYYQQLLNKNPETPLIINNLAWIYMLLDDPRAILLAEKAYKIQAEQINIADTYAAVLLKNKKVEQAIIVLNKAEKQSPDNNTIQFHLAEAYALQDKKLQSISILEKITAENESFPEKRSAQKLLQQLNKLP